MLNVEAKNNEFGKEIKVLDNNNCFFISFGGNGDLYFSAFSSSAKDCIKFTITNEDKYLYEEFLKLYNDICSYKTIYKKENENIEQFYDKLRKYPLVQNNVIVWSSETDEFFKTNKLKIRKEEENIIIEFQKNKNKELDRTCLIRINNSGSYYSPFNYNFMNLYRNLCEVYNMPKVSDFKRVRK